MDKAFESGRREYEKERDIAERDATEIERIRKELKNSLIIRLRATLKSRSIFVVYNGSAPGYENGNLDDIFIHRYKRVPLCLSGYSTPFKTKILDPWLNIHVGYVGWQKEFSYSSYPVCGNDHIIAHRYIFESNKKRYDFDTQGERYQGPSEDDLMASVGRRVAYFEELSE